MQKEKKVMTEICDNVFVKLTKKEKKELNKLN